MSPPPCTLPSDFLTTPAPAPTTHKVNFDAVDLPEYQNRYAIVLDNVFTAAECAQLVRAAEARTDGAWEVALINVGGGRQALMTDVRNCGRIIWDDRSVVEKIWNRIKFLVPETHYVEGAPLITGNGPARRQETWQMTRLNERMRFLKYGAGDYFQPHCDGTYATPDGLERSLYTLHLYLNESEPDRPGGELKGGATTFHSYNMRQEFKVTPKVGRVLVFQQRDLLHSGEEVLAGTKLTLRTELMFEKIGGC